MGLSVKNRKKKKLEEGDSFQSEKSPIAVNEPPLAENPINASSEVSVNNLFVLPPVDDNNFVPKNQVSLAQAAYALAKEVPQSQIASFYQKLNNLVQATAAWQKNEDLSMSNKIEESIRNHIRKLIREESGEEDDLDPIKGMMADLEDDSPEDLEIPPSEIAKSREEMRLASKKIKPPVWHDIKLGKQKRPLEFWEQPGYKPEPAEPVGGRGHPADYDFIAANVEGFSSNSSVRQFLDDQRRVNLLDKIRFMLALPEKERNKIILTAGVDFIEKMESGKIALDPKDPAIKDVIKHYISDLEAEGAIEAEDVADLKKGMHLVVELDTFKKYIVDYFDHNLDALIKFGAFREHLHKYWMEALRSDPKLMAALEARKEADIARVQKDKAEKASKEK